MTHPLVLTTEELRQRNKLQKRLQGRKPLEPIDCSDYGTPMLDEYHLNPEEGEAS